MNSVCSQFVVADDLLCGRTPDTCILEVGELRRRVIPPDPDRGDVSHRDTGLACKQAPRAVLVETGHREPAFVGDLGRMRPCDEAVRVTRVADDEHPDV